MRSKHKMEDSWVGKDKDADSGGQVRRRSRRQVLKGFGAGLVFPSLSSCIQTPRPIQPDMGLVIGRDDLDYESWRTQLSWHPTPSSRRPSRIVRPHRIEQVVDAVRYARASGLKISVKSGGHNYYETWMRNDGLLLDLHDFRDVQVDAQDGTAWVGPSVWSYSLLLALQPHRLTFPVATCATVGMGGYIMGGGIGYGWQDWGMACHNVVAAEVVTANGAVVVASETQHEDLFWAARGGIAGFPGIVTKWKLRCHPDPKAVRVTTKIFPLSKMPEAISASQAAGLRRIDGVHLQAVVVPTPMLGTVFLPPGQAASLGLAESLVCLVESYVFSSSQEAAEDTTKRVFSDSIFSDAVATTTNEGRGLISVYQELKGREVTFTDQICVPVWSDKPTQAIAAVLETLIHAEADVAYLAFLINGRDMHQHDASFSMARSGSGSLSFYGVWFNNNQERTASWAKRMGSLLDPLSEGYYINEVDCFRHPQQVQRSYSRKSWRRLRAINRAHDPDGLFHTFPGFAGT